MDLQIKGQYFVIGGAGKGFGRATAIRLLEEGAHILGIARSSEGLTTLKEAFPGQVTALSIDLTDIPSHEKIVHWAQQHTLSGIFINAGGPPATSFLDTPIQQWDEGYTILLRWKISLVRSLLPCFRKNNYGRILFSESVSVKQPIPDLVLSNAFRMAVVGMAKTLSEEISSEQITVNVLGPGYHDTDAMQRLFRKKSETQHVSVDKARTMFSAQTAVGKLGDPEHFASLAAWLLSPLSAYVTGQVFIVDGGLVKSI
jgi:3-oxoacyl-[acyl-carrier protein] reductase